jgi:hypothetical protein
MPEEPAAIFWDDLPLADQLAFMKRWWALANPEPDSDEYLILQMMSGGAPGYGDPEAAGRELLERGILASFSEHRSDYTERAGSSS